MAAQGHCQRREQHQQRRPGIQLNRLPRSAPPWPLDRACPSDTTESPPRTCRVQTGKRNRGQQEAARVQSCRTGHVDERLDRMDLRKTQEGGVPAHVGRGRQRRSGQRQWCAPRIQASAIEVATVISRACFLAWRSMLLATCRRTGLQVPRDFVKLINALLAAVSRRLCSLHVIVHVEQIKDRHGKKNNDQS